MKKVIAVVLSTFIICAFSAHFHVSGHHHEAKVAVLDSGEDAAFLLWIAFVELGTEVVDELHELPLVIHLPFDDEFVLHPLY